MLLTFYLTGVGLLALGGTVFSVSVSRNVQKDSSVSFRVICSSMRFSAVIACSRYRIHRWDLACSAEISFFVLLAYLLFHSESAFVFFDDCVAARIAVHLLQRPLCPPWLYDDSWLVLRPRGPFLWIRKWLSGPTPSEATRMEHQEHQEEQQEKQQKKQHGQETKLAVDWSWRFSPLWLASHLLALAICILWLITKHWALHNILAIAFCTQVFGYSF